MEATKEYMLTTVDNPWNPFTHFDEWFAFDESHGYCSCGLLARISASTDELSEELENKQNEEAINEIIRYDLTNKYKKVSREDFKDDKGGGS